MPGILDCHPLRKDIPNSEIRRLIGALYECTYLGPWYLESDTLSGQFVIDLGVWFKIIDSVLKIHPCT